MDFEKPKTDPKEGEPGNSEESVDEIIERVEEKEGLEEFAKAESQHRRDKTSETPEAEALKNLTKEEIDKAVGGLGAEEGKVEENK